jgi:hypothetical protein
MYADFVTVTQGKIHHVADALSTGGWQAMKSERNS